MSEPTCFHTSFDNLQSIRNRLVERILEGFSSDNKQIRALPTYLSPPSQDIKGKAIALDVGGTNMRAALVELQGRGKARFISFSPVTRVSPFTESGEFFDSQSRLIQQLNAPDGLPLGYCFSYPSDALPDGDARLIKWTKEVAISGVIGTCVGSTLQKALENTQLQVNSTHVINDTIASLLAASYIHRGPERSDAIGLIVGTGTNMAGFFDPCKVTKLGISNPSEKIAINLESGNYHPPFLTQHDEQVDRESEDPGYQRFEKAVSGNYLPLLFKSCMPQYGDYILQHGAKRLVEEREGKEITNPEAQRIITDLLSRSADFTAAALSAVIDIYESPHKITILAEGSLHWGDPLYAGRVRETLSRLLGGTSKFELVRKQNANFIGAACAALSPLYKSQ
jgi:hexokinase